MAMKKLQILNKDTGEIVEEREFSGGYHFIYANLEDMGNLKHIRKLNNARFGDWDNMIATLGKDWAETQTEIANLIEDDVFWKQLEPASKQLDIFEIKAVK